MSYIIALTIYILSIYVMYKVLGSKWFEIHKNDRLNKRQVMVALLWFTSFTGSQIYIIDGVFMRLFAN